MTTQAEVSYWSKEYSRHFRGLRSTAIAHRPKICPFQEILSEVDSGDSIFDIGCGSGFLLFVAAKLRDTAPSMGVELDASTVEGANAAISLEGLSEHILLAQADSFQEWPDQQFDVVTMIDVAHHVPSDGQANFIEEALARVKPGGKFVYKDMASKPFAYAMANRLHDLLLARQWINYIPIGEVRDICTTKGFVVEREFEIRTLWYAHEGCVLVNGASN